MPDMNDILKMAQQAQQDLAKAQGELDNIEVEGVAGGGLVKIKTTAKGRIVGISIDDSLMSVEEKGMLEDLIAAAFNDAKGKADQAAADLMKRAMPAGFPVPGQAGSPF